MISTKKKREKKRKGKKKREEKKRPRPSKTIANVPGFTSLLFYLKVDNVNIFLLLHLVLLISKTYYKH